jgi:hypothetical protein
VLLSGSCAHHNAEPLQDDGLTRTAPCRQSRLVGDVRHILATAVLTSWMPSRDQASRRRWSLPSALVMPQTRGDHGGPLVTVVVP